MCVCMCHLLLAVLNRMKYSSILYVIHLTSINVLYFIKGVAHMHLVEECMSM